MEKLAAEWIANWTAHWGTISGALILLGTLLGFSMMLRIMGLKEALRTTRARHRDQLLAAHVLGQNGELAPRDAMIPAVSSRIPPPPRKPPKKAKKSEPKRTRKALERRSAFERILDSEDPFAIAEPEPEPDLEPELELEPAEEKKRPVPKGGKNVTR